MLGFLAKAISSLFSGGSPRRQDSPRNVRWAADRSDDYAPRWSAKQTVDQRWIESDQDAASSAGLTSTTEEPSFSLEDEESEDELFSVEEAKRGYLRRIRSMQDQERLYEAKESHKLSSSVTLSRSKSMYACASLIRDDDVEELRLRLRKGAPYHPKESDLVILFRNGERSDGLYGEVVKVNDTTGLIHVEVDAKSSHKQIGAAFHHGTTPWNEWFIKPAVNEVFYKRTDEAFDRLRKRKSSILRVIIGVEAPREVSPPAVHLSSIFPREHHLNDCVCHRCFEEKGGDRMQSGAQEDCCLNDAQERAISRALTRNISLIQGPPGTGKTSTIVQLIKRISLSIGRAKGKILCVTPSNAAADHLAICLLKAGLVVYRPRTAKALKRIKFANSECHKMGLEARSILHPSLPEPRYLKPTKQPQTQCARADVVCATCCYAGSSEILTTPFRYLIVDEAAQATEPEVLVPFSLPSVSRLILVGDHKQLGPTVKSMRGNSDLAISLFERLCKLKIETTMLNEQFRMHASLSLFSSRQFYGNRLRTSASVMQRKLEHPRIYNEPLKLIDVPRGCESTDKISKANEEEARAVITEIRALTSAGVRAESIKIITPYVAQKDLIKSKMAPHLKNLIHVGSVDSMQGSEADVVIVSTVRSNEEKQIGFVKDPRRMNVTLTRAKYKLILVCNVQTLMANRLWNNYLADFDRSKNNKNKNKKNKKNVRTL